MSTEKLRVLLADDHPTFRRGLRVLLEQLGVDVVCECSDGRAAVESALAHNPDVVIMDLAMPALDGTAATRELLRARPDARVLVLTMFDDDESVFSAMKAGALGYLLKGADDDEIARAIAAVAAGEALYGPAVARRILRFFESGGSAPGAPFPELTQRERQTLDLVAQGLDNISIGRQLGISGKTVRNNISSIFAKLRVADRAQAIVLAREAGLGDRRSRRARVD